MKKSKRGKRVPLWRFGLFCPGHGELSRDLSQRAHHFFPRRTHSRKESFWGNRDRDLCYAGRAVRLLSL
jgi:hypothetical protein